MAGPLEPPSLWSGPRRPGGPAQDHPEESFPEVFRVALQAHVFESTAGEQSGFPALDPRSRWLWHPAAS